jgi:transposase-like protein
MTEPARSASDKLTGEERKTIALQALAGAESISALAARNGVSRPTVYRQMNRADAALDELFLPAIPGDNAVLFMLPVTRQWLEQVTLALTFVGHASFRGAIEFMRDLLGVPISLGTVHEIHQRAA